jgi:hypothetical protein
MSGRTDREKAHRRQGSHERAIVPPAVKRSPTSRASLPVSRSGAVMGELPPTDTKRWVARRKAAVVTAVRTGKITLEEALRRYQLSEEEFRSWQRAFETYGFRVCARHPSRAPISWIIVGGESGGGARPMHPDWVRGLRDQVRAAGAKLFVKQVGSNHTLWPSVSGKGEDPAQWPADLRVQEFPQ